MSSGQDDEDEDAVVIPVAVSRGRIAKSIADAMCGGRFRDDAPLERAVIEAAKAMAPRIKEVVAKEVAAALTDPAIQAAIRAAFADGLKAGAYERGKKIAREMKEPARG